MSEQPTCEEWKRRLIEHLKSGNATDEHWDVVAGCVLAASEVEGLDGDLDDVISEMCQ